jgi:hypothetical protein
MNTVEEINQNISDGTLASVAVAALSLLCLGDEASVRQVLIANLDDEGLILLRGKALRLAEICLPLALRQAGERIEAQDPESEASKI